MTEEASRPESPSSSAAESSSSPTCFHIYQDQEDRDLNDWLKVYQHIEPAGSALSTSSATSSSSASSAVTSSTATSTALTKKTVAESVVLSRLMQNARSTLEMLSSEQKKQKRRKKPHREAQITELQLLYNDTMALIRWVSHKISNNHNKGVKKQQPFKCAL